MTDRYSIKQGMYNLFSQKISVGDWADRSVFAHEFCHHIHNLTTVIAGERLNMFTQILVQMSAICASNNVLKVPFNAWHEEIMKTPPVPYNRNNEILKDRLTQLWEHQKIWEYLDKISYKKKKSNELENMELFTKFLAVVDEPEFYSKTPYVLFYPGEEITAYPIGFFQVMESAAFALQLWYENADDKSIIYRYMDDYPEYTIILYYVSQYIADFRTACLLTFLLCDLSLCTYTPALGFLLFAYDMHKTVTKDFTEKQCFKWYKNNYKQNLLDIRDNYREELKVAAEIRKQMSTINNEIDNVYKVMFDYLLGMIEKGLSHIELKDRKQLLNQLLNIEGRSEMEALMRLYPMPVLELNNKNWYILDEKYSDVPVFLDAVNKLYLGLCRDFNVIKSDNEIFKHFEERGENRYNVKIKEENGRSDVYGYLFHLFELNQKTIEVLLVSNYRQDIKYVLRP